ncbi:hypothetical protein BGZ57DRAFT_144408 [Hyaloscypha finlandica]|nr:hypothetical protein BGZ57DRAFT_144408 [Hyaloscypha finlandica]
MIRCPWPSCVAHHTLFQNDAEASFHHFHTHQSPMLESWNGPTKCSWPNCSSTLFKEKYLLNTHLENIHVAPLRCSVAGCSRLQPFGKKCDLNRHVREIHETLRIPCPVESCESNSIGFTRKYKLDKHMREEHDNVRCTLNHCGASILDGEQESHIKDAHDDYECGLSACEGGLPSRFTKEAARLHLISTHKMDRETALFPFTTLYDSQWNHLISRTTFKRFDLIKKFEDCQACLDSLPGAK